MSLDLSFPRRPYVEAYLGGDWRNLTPDVRQDPGIRIERGRKNEATKATPGKCSFVLDDGPEHGNGSYSPRNPQGAWFGQLGRNLPVRVGLEVGTDAFARDVVSGWGDSPANGPWTATGLGTFATSVAGGVGVHSVTSAPGWAMTYLDGVEARDVDVSVTVTTLIANVLGGDLEPANLIVRGQNTSDYYMARLTVTSAEIVTLTLMVGDTTIIAGPLSLDVYTGQAWRVRVNMEQSHLMAKAWPATDPEPLDWQLDSVRPSPFDAGFVGIRSGVGSGNTNTKPIQFEYDDLEIRLPRFAGEASKLKPASNLTHTDRTVTVECGGLLRRISRYTKELQSPVRRWLTTTTDLTLNEYWPLEEPPTATVLGGNIIPGGAPAKFTRTATPTGGVKWGVTDVPPSVVAAPELTNGGMLTLPIRPQNDYFSSWSVAWSHRVSADAGARIWFRTTNPASDFNLVFYTDGSADVFIGTAGTLVMSLTPQHFGTGFDDVWHAFSFTCESLGGSGLKVHLMIDSVINTSGTVVVALNPITRAEFVVDANTTGPGAFSHVAVYPEIPDVVSGLDIFDYWRSFFGWTNAAPGGGVDAAASRFVRLCREQSIPVSWAGPLGVSPPMGPQAPTTIVKLLQECVDLDQGTLYEPRSLTALAIRTTRSLVEQTSRVELDYGNKEIFPEFGPTEDDQATLNDVTAKAAYGGEVRYEQTEGPNNVDDPGTSIGAVGRYDATVTVNPQDDSQLLDAAGWLVHLGTVDEPRFPTITVDLAATAITAALAAQLLDVNVDDKLTVANVINARLYEDVRQIVRGYTEVLDTAYSHRIVFNTSPASPYDSATLDDDAARLDSGTSTLAENLDTTETGIDVIHTGGARWTTDVADFPFDILVSGERMTVTNISLTVTQLFTVVRSVNGVVKSHAAGDKVRLANPIYLVPGG